MRPVAEFIMRGRMQAMLVAAGATLIPLLFWLGAAAVVLVWLRRGVRDGFPVFFAALIPAAFWMYQGDLGPLLVLVGSTVLAQVLRQTVDWRWVLAVSILVGAGFSVVLNSLLPPVMDALMVRLEPLLQNMGQSLTAPAELDAGQYKEVLQSALLVLMPPILQIASLLCLALGRSWQAALYNPGGLTVEFGALQLPRWLIVVLFAGLLLLPGAGGDPRSSDVGEVLFMLGILCAVPLIAQGLAIAHGLVSQGRIQPFWLVMLYAGLLFLPPLYPLLIVLAVVDVFFNLRGIGSDRASDHRNKED